MKKLIPCTLLVLLATACKKDFIELTPITTPSAVNFYKTSSDMINAINATYAVLQSSAAAGNEFMFGDLPTDDAQSLSTLCAQGHCDFDNFQSRASGSGNAGAIAARWNDAYRGISRANIVLDRIGPVDMDANLKNRVIGEAKFLRAYYYFNIAKIFGAVPLVLKELMSQEEAYDYGREPVDNVFTQIQKDLTEAITTLPATYGSADLGRATSGAAKAMLARVLLFRSKHSEAAPLLKDIIDNQSPAVYDLLPNYADVFKDNNGNNKEILFAVQYTANSVATGEGNPVTGSFAPVSAPGVSVAGPNANQPTQDMYNAFAADDTVRRKVNIGSYVSSGLTTYYVNKFINRDIKTAAENGTDYPVLRYADVLLMYAECVNEATGVAAALPFINRVRTRAGLASLQNTDAGTPATYVANQAAMRDRIMQERRLEFAFEGLRFFDLVRTNRLLPVLNGYFTTYNIIVNGSVLQIENYQKLFPVPQAQIDINPARIGQNEGYLQ
jgi:hypothetical protein